MGKRQNLKSYLLTLVCAGLFISMMVLVQFGSTSNIHAADPQFTQNQLSIADSATTIDSQQANCRYGITTAEHTAQVVTGTGAGVFYKFNQPNWYGPLPENDAELLHMIKTRQRKTATGEYLPGWYTDGVHLNEELADFIRADLGAIWIIGNEVERGPNPGETWTARTGDMFPEVYAEAYHDIYHFIKGVDPTARVANAGLIQITPMRLQYLDKMWAAYQIKYGTNMPVDVWTIHTYVLPEVTPQGDPNGIASAALGTDVTLGKRQSGGDTSQCPDDMVYCYAEHDDMTILTDQIVAMRQWMKDRGEQDKPLIVTEYGTLYHYIVKEDGSCGGKRDEFGNCFVPERVTKFLLDSFDYFNNTGRDANLGLASDNNRLVQQWIWYGAWEWNIASSNLLQHWNSTELTMMGEAYRAHVQAESTYVNLVVDEVNSSLIAYEDDETATAKISVSIRNNGNVPVEDSFKVTFYHDEALTQPIGSTIIPAGVRGCASRAYNAEIEWKDLQKGVHPFWVRVDSDNNINENPANKTDNIGYGTVETTGSAYMLEIEVTSDGLGQGGVVTTEPKEVVHTIGTVVTLTAVPFAGWSFDGWSGAIIGSNPTAQVTIFENTMVKALFKQNHYELDINTTGEGAVIVNPKPVQDTYLYGDQVELAAVPEAGWRFVGWSGDIVSEALSLNITLDSDVNVTAEFEQVLVKIESNILVPVILRN